MSTAEQLYDGKPVPPELQFPDFRLLIRFDFIAPFLVYLAFFRYASHLVKTKLWLSYTGFKQYRLHNLSVCFLHALISGTWSLWFMLTHQHEVLHDVVYWWGTVASQLPIISIAYFVQDALDMAKNEWSRWMVELLIHHILTCIALATPYVPRRFLLANYWALLMETNSIFLHARTIMQISGYAKSQPNTFRGVIYLNIITFVLFRIAAQVLFLRWAFGHLDQMHTWFIVVAVYGPISFGVINGMLLLRLLVADDFLPDRFKKFFAVNRDAQDDERRDKEGLANGTTSKSPTSDQNGNSMFAAGKVKNGKVD